jgi:hypothetical protein
MPIEIDSTESISLVYYQQGFGSDEFHGYVLKDSDGNIIVDQNESGQVPQSVYDIVVCEYLDVSGIDEQGNDFDISVYPNPSNGTFTFRGDIPYPNCSLSVIDMHGRQVHSQSVSAPSIELNDLTDGLYQVSLRSSDNLLWNGRILITR